jgi:formate hydrogenlyase subunit 3/multisubunit Na+/H+ antiporter MnhD subunit
MVIAVMKCLAFLAAGMYEYYTGSQDIERLRGVGKHMPLAALSLSIALAGLAGIPLLAGFNGKWLIFSAALMTADAFALSCLLVFMLSSVISLGGYLPMIIKQYQDNPQPTLEFEGLSQPDISKWMLFPVGFLSLLVILIGIFPSPWINLVNQVMQWMLMSI